MGSRGTYCTLPDYRVAPWLPALRVSLSNGGVFVRWGSKAVENSIFFTASVILDKREPRKFPEVFKVVWDIWERIKSESLYPRSIKFGTLRLLTSDGKVTSEGLIYEPTL